MKHPVRKRHPLHHRGELSPLRHQPKEYLTDVRTRLPGMLDKDAIRLTPANWFKARNGKPQRIAA